MADLSLTSSTRNRYVSEPSLPSGTDGTLRPRKPDLHNPFKGLAHAAQELELQASARRSFTPVEWYSYLDSVEECTDVELRLIGLLMLYTGCRTSEAYGAGS